MSFPFLESAIWTKCASGWPGHTCMNPIGKWVIACELLERWTTYCISLQTMHWKTPRQNLMIMPLMIEKNQMTACKRQHCQHCWSWITHWVLGTQKWMGPRLARRFSWRCSEWQITVWNRLELEEPSALIILTSDPELLILESIFWRFTNSSYLPRSFFWIRPSLNFRGPILQSSYIVIMKRWFNCL